MAAGTVGAFHCAFPLDLVSFSISVVPLFLQYFPHRFYSFPFRQGPLWRDSPDGGHRSANSSANLFASLVRLFEIVVGSGSCFVNHSLTA